jgi:acyl carrier protein
MCAIEEMKREGSEEQFKAKVEGVRVLEEVMEGEGVEFCVLISSLSSVLGGLGFAAYAGGNVYMDSYAAKQNRKGGEGAERWISINLDGWRGGERKGGEEEEEMVIRGREVVEVVEKAVRQRGQGQVVVSVSDLGTRINEWVRMGEKKKEKEREELKKYVRPEMGKEYRGASTAVETRIVEIWEELLGIEGVGVDDNFFELGGHSLLATQVTSRLREAFKLDIPLRSTFEKPTISKMSSTIEELLLNEIEELSEEEAQHLLNDPAGELQRSYGSRLE